MEERIKNIFIRLLTDKKSYIDKYKSSSVYLVYNISSTKVTIANYIDVAKVPSFSVYIKDTSYPVMLSKRELYTYEEIFNEIYKDIENQVISEIEAELGSKSLEGDLIDEPF